MRPGRKAKRGMTLLEMCVVLVILTLLTAIAIPASLRSRATARTRACIANMRVVDCAKQQWAMEFGKSATETPGWVDLAPYIRAVDGSPTCPEGNVPYALNQVRQKTVCPNVGRYPNHMQR
jgi:prepilin-type N-terminal cleavage/methylation domain-containing protein